MRKSLIMIITILILIIIIDPIIWSQRNETFLKKYVNDISLYKTIKSSGYYQDLLEPSIKIKLLSNGKKSINNSRYTIPIRFGDIGSSNLSTLISKFVPEKEQKFATTFTERNITSLSDDIIFGVDIHSGIHKIYIDRDGFLICLEIPGRNIKTYEKINKISAYKKIQSFDSYKLLDDFTLSKWKNVLSKQDNKISEDITGYHIYLDEPTKISALLKKNTNLGLDDKFLNDYVYWISLSNKELTFYTRLKQSYIGKIREMTQLMLMIFVKA